MTQAVAESVDDATGQTTIDQADLSVPLGAMAESISSYVASTLKAISAATYGLQRRTNLLWWKEALFSPESLVSYRDLTPASAATMMAFDLHKQVPEFSPASVTAFLSETVLSLPAVDHEATYAIRELVEQAQTHADLAALRNAAADLVSPPEGRGPLLALIAYPDDPTARTEGEFLYLTGLPPDVRLKLPDWATWIFRELQAATATTGGARAKRRTRRA